MDSNNIGTDQNPRGNNLSGAPSSSGGGGGGILPGQSPVIAPGGSIVGSVSSTTSITAFTPATGGVYVVHTMVRVTVPQAGVTMVMTEDTTDEGGNPVSFSIPPLDCSAAGNSDIGPSDFSLEAGAPFDVNFAFSGPGATLHYNFVFIQVA